LDIDNPIRPTSNQPCQPVDLSHGGSHVAVGFVDQGELLISDSRTIISLNWVGFKESGYAVAKTLLITEMLLNGAEVGDALQVWLSALWTRSALRAFRCAIVAVLRRTRGDPALRAANVILGYWHESDDVLLSDARRCWLDAQ
jgi:hypothetical protein